MSFHVFLSHSSADKPAVEELARRLAAEGIQVWLDKCHLIPGDPWQPAIEKAWPNRKRAPSLWVSVALAPWQNEEMRGGDRSINVSAIAGALFRTFTVHGETTHCCDVDPPLDGGMFMRFRRSVSSPDRPRRHSRSMNTRQSHSRRRCLRYSLLASVGLRYRTFTSGLKFRRSPSRV